MFLGEERWRRGRWIKREGIASLTKSATRIGGITERERERGVQSDGATRERENGEESKRKIERQAKRRVNPESLDSLEESRLSPSLEPLLLSSFSFPSHHCCASSSIVLLLLPCSTTVLVYLTRRILLSLPSQSSPPPPPPSSSTS